jgi:2-polyprenyl-3-methyl-5-hydroxy-6-metoxy-1,4-benzoquinol methylase
MESNESWPARILDALGRYAPTQCAKLKRLLPLEDPVYRTEAGRFLEKWFARPGAWPLVKAAEAHARLLEEMQSLQAEYARTGAYPHTSFSEVNTAVYSNPVRMREHLEALALAQFLWIDQWERYVFFSKWIDRLHTARHLEIGPGHGLYLERTVRALSSQKASITAIDVSAASLETARAIAGDSVRWLAADFLQWEPEDPVDSITMGEVLEHVEQPADFLNKVHQCLRASGEAFISSPLHAPMPDHISAFPDVPALRNLIKGCGFDIIREHQRAVDGLPLELAQRFLKPIMFCALIRPV